MNDKDREAFEALIKDEMPSYNFSFRTYAKEHRKLDEMYMNPALHNLWLTWQAALATRPDVNQELVEALEDIENKLANMRKERACSWAYYVSCIDKIIQKALAKHKVGESAGFTEDRLEEL